MNITRDQLLQMWESAWMLSKGFDKPSNQPETDYKREKFEQCVQNLEKENNMKFQVYGDVVKAEQNNPTELQPKENQPNPENQPEEEINKDEQAN